MLLKLKIATTKHAVPVNQAWSTIVANVRTHRQRDRDRHILARMNDHDLRDIGLSHSGYNPVDRAR